MKKKPLLIALTTALFSCSTLSYFNRQNSCLLSENIIKCHSIRNILSIDSLLTNDFYSIRIFDVTAKLKLCSSSFSIDSGIFATTYLTHNFPLTFNSGIKYRDLAILKIEKNKNIIQTTIAATGFRTCSNQRVFNFVYLCFRITKNNTLELIFENVTQPDMYLFPDKYYEKEYYKAIKKNK